MEWLTSSTLLQRLAASRDQGGWTEIVDAFRAPIVRLGRRMGLSDEDAEDAAQNALLAFTSAYREGRYDAGKGRLRQWLFGIATRQIQNLRRRQGGDGPHRVQAQGLSGSFLERVPDPHDEQALWDEEWRRTVYERALQQVRAESSPQTFEIFRRLILEEQPADEIVKDLGVTRTLVYNAKYRVARRLSELAQAFEDC